MSGGTTYATVWLTRGRSRMVNKQVDGTHNTRSVIRDTEFSFVAFSPPESVDVVLSAAASHVAAKTRGEVARFLAWL